MTALDTIRDLCKQKGISIAQLEKDLGYGNGSLSKSDSIKASRIYEISQYFDVSMEQIMTGEEPQEYYLDPEVAKLAQEIFENPEKRILMDASRDVSRQDVLMIAELMTRLKRKGAVDDD